MPPSTATPPVIPRPEPRAGVVRMVQSLVYMAGWMALLFACAGRLDYMRGWICSLTLFVPLLIIGWVVQRHNPGLFAARAQWRRKDTKRFDKIILPVVLALHSGLPAVAGLDVRFQRPLLPMWTVYAGVPVALLGMALMGRTMEANQWAEATVRIQTDRGQRVVRSGPYRWVRHPLYLGIILMYSGCAAILGGLDTLPVAGALGILVVVRTALEDRTLRRELEGYSDYAAVTRWRLLPRIW